MLTKTAAAASRSRFDAGRDADGALDVQDLEAAVVEQLLACGARVVTKLCV